MLQKIHILVISMMDKGGVYQPVAAGCDAETAEQAFQDWQHSPATDRSMWRWDVRVRQGWIWLRFPDLTKP